MASSRRWAICCSVSCCSVVRFMSDRPAYPLEIVDAIPPTEERKDHTLYILDRLGKDERDQRLGAFMDSWSELELKALLLTWRLLDVPYHIAEAVFHSSINVRSQLDAITALMTLRQSDARKRWLELRESFLMLSNHRNNLVHGRWARDITIGFETPTRPIAIRIDWVRLYMTGDPEKNLTKARTKQTTNKEKVGQHRYDLARILKRMNEVQNLDRELNAFRESLYPSLPGVRQQG